MEKLVYGNYPQGNNGEIQPLVWNILERTDDGVLLITQDVVDCQPFHETGKAWEWENCSIHNWLNTQFMDKAFSQSEREKISKIFLLNNEEVLKYFPSDFSRLAKPTDYAKSKGVLEYDGNKKSWWWVSSHGSGVGHVSFVSYDGFLFMIGRKGNAENYGVRPAIFMTIK